MKLAMSTLLGLVGVSAFSPPLEIQAMRDLPGFTDCSYYTEHRGDCTMRPKLAGQVSIACVGDSITAGGWPQIMQTNLNAKYPNKYLVSNFGESGATLQRAGDSPYVLRASWPQVLASNADIVIIMLGTNDAKNSVNNGPHNWENDGVNTTGIESYKTDYAFFVQTFSNFTSKPQIYAAVPPPLYQHSVYGMDAVTINNVYPLLLPQLVKDLHISGPIDIFNTLGGITLSHPEWSSDGCHPNADGYGQLALAMQQGLGL